MNIEEFELSFLTAVDPHCKDLAVNLISRMVSEQHSPEVYSRHESELNMLKKSYAEMLIKRAIDLLPSDPLGALKDFISSLGYNSDSSVYVYISKCFIRLGSLDTAEHILHSIPDSCKDLLYVRTCAELKHAKGDLDSAIKLLRPISSDDPDVQYQLATYLIKNKEFTEGWDLYSSRFSKLKNPVPYPKFEVPLWSKDKDPGVLLVHWEQGFGDTIMFSRFLPLLEPYCKSIYFAVRKPMVSLMQNNFPTIKVVEDTNIPSNIDYHLPLMSIMHALDIQIKDISGAKYLEPDLPCPKIMPDRFKVGLSWQGSVAGMPERNMILQDFIPLLVRKDISFFSFQAGIGLAQAKPLFKDLGLVDFGSDVTDFGSTAFSLSGMDLFISTDNCLANLAGALGVKTILLLNKNSEFRWMDATDTTPWYDSVSIIKQTSFGDWSDCIQRVLERI